MARTRAINYCSDVKTKQDQLEIVRRFDGDIRFVGIRGDRMTRMNQSSTSEPGNNYF